MPSHGAYGFEKIYISSGTNVSEQKPTRNKEINFEQPNSGHGKVYKIEMNCWEMCASQTIRATWLGNCMFGSDQQPFPRRKFRLIPQIVFVVLSDISANTFIVILMLLILFRRSPGRNNAKQLQKNPFAQWTCSVGEVNGIGREIIEKGHRSDEGK